MRGFVPSGLCRSIPATTRCLGSCPPWLQPCLRMEFERESNRGNNMFRRSAWSLMRRWYVEAGIQQEQLGGCTSAGHCLITSQCHTAVWNPALNGKD
jgi:hypothetical protein